VSSIFSLPLNFIRAYALIPQRDDGAWMVKAVVFREHGVDAVLRGDKTK
jgi:hypothetical protein